METSENKLCDATKTILETKERFLDVISGLPETMGIIKQTGVDIAEIKKELQDIVVFRKELEKCKDRISELEKQIEILNK